MLLFNKKKKFSYALRFSDVNNAETYVLDQDPTETWLFSLKNCVKPIKFKLLHLISGAN